MAWTVALVVCVVAIVSGLLSGADRRNHSPGLPGFAFTEGADPGDAVQPYAQLRSFESPASLTVAAGRARRGTDGTATVTSFAGRDRLADKRASDTTRSGARAPHLPASQPNSSGGREPSSGGREPSTGGREPSAPSIPSKPSVPQTPSLPRLPSAPLPSPPHTSPQPQAPAQPVPALPTPKPQVSVSTPAVHTPVASVPSVTVQLP